MEKVPIQSNSIRCECEEMKIICIVIVKWYKIVDLIAGKRRFWLIPWEGGRCSNCVDEFRESRDGNFQGDDWGNVDLFLHKLKYSLI